MAPTFSKVKMNVNRIGRFSPNQRRARERKNLTPKKTQQTHSLNSHTNTHVSCNKVIIETSVMRRQSSWRIARQGAIQPATRAETVPAAG